MTYRINLDPYHILSGIIKLFFTKMLHYKFIQWNNFAYSYLIHWSTLWLLGDNFACFFVVFFFSKYFSVKNYFSNKISITNSLDPDQAQHFVGLALGPNCLQKLSAGDTSRQRVNTLTASTFCSQSLQTIWTPDLAQRF